MNPNAAFRIPDETIAPILPKSAQSEPARLIRLPEVIARVGLKRSSIYQRMADGRFPRSRSLGPKCTVWVESEIDEWIATVASASSL